MNTRERITVLCADDDETVLDFLQLSLGVEPDIAILGSVTNADNLISEVARKLPDIVILDVSMPGRDAIEAVKELSATFSTSRVIAHSGRADSAVVERLFEAGAWGYVMKGLPRAALIRMIREVAHGQHRCLAA